MPRRTMTKETNTSDQRRGRFHQKRMVYVKYCIHVRHNIPLDSITTNWTLKDIAVKGQIAVKDMSKRNPEVHQIPRDLVLVLSLLREFLRPSDATGPAKHTHFAFWLAPALFRRCRGVPSAQQCVFAQRTNAMWRSDSSFGSTWTVSPEWRPVARSVVPVLVLSMLGSSACKKSAANRFDAREGLLVVVRRTSLDNTLHGASLASQQLHVSKSLVTRRPRCTRVFADGEAVARLKTKSLETALGRTKSVVRLAKQSRKFLLSAQKIVEADPCLASIPGLLRGLRVICLFLTT